MVHALDKEGQGKGLKVFTACQGFEGTQRTGSDYIWSKNDNGCVYGPIFGPSYTKF